MTPQICEECKIPMNRIEDIRGVEISYNWNEETKEYEEADMHFYGDTEIRYECSNCEETREE